MDSGRLTFCVVYELYVQLCYLYLFILIFKFVLFVLYMFLFYVQHCKSLWTWCYIK